MNIFDFYQKKIIETIKKNKKILKISEVNFNGMQVELAPEKFNCDISTNIAMLLTKRNKKDLQLFSHDLKDLLILNQQKEELVYSHLIEGLYRYY